MFSLGAILASPIALHSALASCLVMAVHFFGAVRVFQNERWPSFTSVFFIGKHQLSRHGHLPSRHYHPHCHNVPETHAPPTSHRAYWPDDQRTAATPQALVPSSTQDQVRGGCTRQEWSSAGAAPDGRNEPAHAPESPAQPRCTLGHIQRHRTPESV